MIYPIPIPWFSILSADLQLSGDYHGEWNSTYRSTLRRTRRTPQHDAFCRHLSQLFHCLVVQRWSHHSGNRPTPRLQSRNCQAHSATVSGGWHCRLAAQQTAWASQQSVGVVPGTFGRGGANQPPNFGLRLFHVVDRALGGAPGQGYRNSLQQQSDSSPLASGTFFGASPQAHHERQTGRSGLPKSQKPASTAQKKALAKDA